jgi:putative glutamine transport system substrate-binding protein
MKNNIKKSVLLMLMSFTLFPSIAQVQGDNWAVVKSKGLGSISLAYVETPGFVYKDAAGNLTGVCVDIMNDFVKYVNQSKNVNLKTNYVGDGSSFSKMFASVKSGKNGVFGLGNITITDARKKEIRFSPSFIQNVAILITHKSIPTLATMSESTTKFKGLKAYAAKGTLNEKRIKDIKTKYMPSLSIEYAASSPETMTKVVSDSQSFTYLDIAFYLDAMKTKKPLKRHGVGDQASEEFGLIMPMSSDWQPLVNEFFSQGDGYVNSIQYKKILAKHLGTAGVKLIESLK